MEKAKAKLRTIHKDDKTEEHIAAIKEQTGENFTVMVKRLLREEADRIKSKK